MKPQRIQRKRTEGYNMQVESLALNGLPAVSVSRPSKYGNPFPCGGYKAPAKECYEDWIYKRRTLFGWPAPTIEEIQSDLRGKNLACFCKLSDPCHADVLLELANKIGA